MKDKSIIQAKIYELKQLRHDNAIKVDKAKKKIDEKKEEIGEATYKLTMMNGTLACWEIELRNLQAYCESVFYSINVLQELRDKEMEAK